MTDGSLKLKETDRTSRSYTEMTSTFPWHQSVIAFCQWNDLERLVRGVEEERLLHKA